MRDARYEILLVLISCLTFISLEAANAADLLERSGAVRPSSHSRQFALTIKVVRVLGSGGTGNGTVTSTPAGIACGSTCSVTFNGGIRVTLTATPAAGSTFAGWSGPGCANGAVTMDANKNCTATFQTSARNVETARVSSGFSPGLLKVSTTNPRYFMDSTGKTVLLNGHSGCPFLAQDGWGIILPVADDVGAGKENFCRSWVWENSRWADGSVGNVYNANGLIRPLPFKRTGPGVALDGAPKFDLSQFDQTFFDRLRSGVIEAARKGLYVDVMLFQGWSVRKGGGFDPWFGHYFNSNNNMNGINGDLNGDGDGGEVFTLANPAITEIQEAYVRKMIDTLADLDNIIWEIANEAPEASRQWQYQMIDLIRSYEATKPKQHPIGMSASGTDNKLLFASRADWIAPGALSWDSATDPYISNPPVADGSKVIVSDVDHLGFGAFENNRLALQWIWKTFIRGYNLLYQEMPASTAATAGSVLSYANKMKLGQMTPQNALSSTGYVLANPGEEYLIYQPNSGEAFTVNLNRGSYDYEWFDPSTGRLVESGRLIESSGNRAFRAPFMGDAVLYLKSTNAPSATAIPPGPSIPTPPSLQILQ